MIDTVRSDCKHNGMSRVLCVCLVAIALLVSVSDVFAQRGRVRCYLEKGVHYYDPAKVTWLENILAEKPLYEGWNLIAEITNCDVLHAYVENGKITRWVMVDGYGGLSYKTYFRESTRPGYLRLVWERWKGSSRFIEAPESVLRP